MRNRQAAELAASQEVGNDVTFVKEMEFGAANLTVWQCSIVKPARRVVVVECTDDRLIVPTRDFKEFEAMLQEIRPSLTDTDVFTELFGEASPSRRKVLVREDQVLPKYRDVWKPVSANGTTVSLYCDDLLAGKFERVTVNSEYSITVELIGPGRKFALR